MRVEEIIAESREKRETMQRLQKRISAILGTIQIDCGISDKWQFFVLIERIASDTDITAQLNILIQNGVRIWVNYGELMKLKCRLDENGSLMIADTASLDDIRAYLRILPS